MTVRLCDVTFSDWASLPFEDGYTDTFIFRIDARACIPPFEYAPLLRRMVAHTLHKRRTASIWVQVDAPGEWYVAEVRRSLAGLKLPYAVTQGNKLDYLDFKWQPWLGYEPSKHPPTVEDRDPLVSHDELRCLQALGRMAKGHEQEIASLAGLSDDVITDSLANLREKGLTVHKTSSRIRRDKSKLTQMDLFPLWHIMPKGLGIALRSWGVPKGIEFTSRLEENLPQIGNKHRYISRIWSTWLKCAWSQAEIWTSWSEVRIPEISVIPDGLAWGRIHGYETLFWLEVGDGHKSRDEIIELTKKRLEQAQDLCERTGVRLVYVQLSAEWVNVTARRACVQLPREVAVVMGNQRKFGELPIIEWGKTTGI